ncbi:MAG: hypothetical protein P1V18_03005 [Candidatus Gracilibacteria bacterium]|nr:hypothetical protein [Candidatus Gracilibacteria bacterium]
MRILKSILGISAIFTAVCITLTSVMAQDSSFFLQGLEVIDAKGDERAVNINGETGIDISIGDIEDTSLLEMKVTLKPGRYEDGIVAIADSLDPIERTNAVYFDNISKSVLIPLESLTSAPNIFLRLIDNSGVEEYHRLELVRDFNENSRPTGISSEGTTTAGAPPGVGGVGILQMIDDCPIAALCPKPYEFGAAYFSGVGGILTHPEHDGPHFFYEEGRIALGTRKFLANGLLDPSADADFHGYDDGTVTRDQEGLAIRTNTLNQPPFSTSTLLQIETQHLFGPTCDPTSPITCQMGTLVTARYEKTGEPHQYTFKVLDIKDVRSEGRQTVAISPADFTSEGWIRLLYFDYDIDTISMNPSQTRADLMQWDGSHSSLSSILGWAAEIVSGEIEDYQYRVNCNGEMVITVPGEIAFSKEGTCTAGSPNLGSVTGQASGSTSSLSSSASGTTGVTTGGSTTGGSSSVQNSCNFNKSTLSIICTPTGQIITPGQPIGPPLITIVDDLFNTFKALQPSQQTSEERMKFIYFALMAILPTL